MAAISKKDSFEAAKTSQESRGLLQAPISPIFLDALSSFNTSEIPILGEILYMNDANFTRSVQGSVLGLSPNRLLFGRIRQNLDDHEQPDFIYNSFFIVSAAQEQDLQDLREGAVVVSSDSTSAISSVDELAAAFELEEQGGDLSRLTSNADRNIINSSVTAGENPFESRSPTQLSSFIEQNAITLSALISGESQPQENLQLFKPVAYTRKDLFKKLTVNKTSNLDLKLKGLSRRTTNA